MIGTDGIDDEDGATLVAVVALVVPALASTALSLIAFRTESTPRWVVFDTGIKVDDD
jgi:hypothetical protein